MSARDSVTRIDQRLPALRLRGKLLTAFVGLAIGPVAMVAIYGVSAASDALTRASANHLRLQLETVTRSVATAVDSLSEDARSLAEAVASIQGDLQRPDDGARARLGTFLAAIARSRPQLEQVRLLSSAGAELVRVERDEDDVVRLTPRDELQDKSGRYYFKEALESPPGVTYVSPMDLNIERGQVQEPWHVVFRVAHTIRDHRGEPRGVVVLNARAPAILRQMDVLRPVPEADVLLVDAGGRYVRERCARKPCSYSFGDIWRDRAGLSPAVAAKLHAGETELMARSGDGFVSFAPVGGSRSPGSWRIAIIYPAAWLLAPVRRMELEFYGFAAAVAAMAAALGLLAAATLRRPITQLLAYLRAVAGREPPPLVDVRTRDELQLLAERVVETAEALADARARLERLNAALTEEVTSQVAEISALLESKHDLERQVQRADRLASLGLLSTSLAHEVGNPLASMKTVLQVRLREPELDAETREDLEIVVGEIDRLVEILDRVRGFVRPAPAQDVSVTVAEVLRRISVLVEREARAAGVDIVAGGGALDLALRLEGGRLEQVLLNVIVNALQALDGPGRIEVVAERDGERLRLTVSDDGPGLEPAALARAFEPFYTSKPGGTGLGLPIVRRIVGEMGGRVDMTSRPGERTTLSVVFPAGVVGPPPAPAEAAREA